MSSALPGLSCPLSEACQGTVYRGSCHCICPQAASRRADGQRKEV